MSPSGSSSSSSSSSLSTKEMDPSLPSKTTCVLDPNVVNAETLPQMTDLGLSFFAPLCGRNRGAFVLDPPVDGKTWGCTDFPDDFVTLAGLDRNNTLVIPVTTTTTVNVTDGGGSTDTTSSNATDAGSGARLRMLKSTSASSNATSTSSSSSSSNATTVEEAPAVPATMNVTTTTVVTEPLLKDANSIKERYADGNLTAAETVQLLDELSKLVYYTSADKSSDVYGCNVGGLAKLQCALPPVNTIATIRSVTLAGLFTYDPWATNGKRLTLDEAQGFYSPADFQEMRQYGINTVQITVPLDAFQVPTNDPGTNGILPVLTDYLNMIQGASLQAILALGKASRRMVQADADVAAVLAATDYALDMSSVVFGLTIPPPPSDVVDPYQAETKTRGYIEASRSRSESLILFVPINLGQLVTLDSPIVRDDPNIFASLPISHTSSIGDIASSTAEDDRMKLFYHENVACIQRSPLEFGECYKRTPVFVSSGFDLAIDDCVFKGLKVSHRDAEDDDGPVPYRFVDFGQCDHFDETVDSPWWHRHRASFAARQLFAYEQGLGWSFATWKLYGETEFGTLDGPAKLLSFKDVAAAGLIPELTEKTSHHEYAIKDRVAFDACLNPPVADFVMGDRTYAPTPAPLNCWPGWVDPNTGNCTYWVPPATEPPVTAPPVECPACPECESGSSDYAAPAPSPSKFGNRTAPAQAPSLIPNDDTKVSASSALGDGTGAVAANNNAYYWTGGIGVVVGVVLMVGYNKLFGRPNRRGYTEIPSGSGAHP